MWEELLKSFIMLLVIMDPFGGIPIFIMLTKNDSKEKMRLSAHRAARVATILIIIFLFLGTFILEFFSISLESFKIAGGIILFLVGLGYVLDIQFGSQIEEKDYSRDITIPMATPLIAGPGVISAVLISVSLYGYVVTLVAALVNLLLFWLGMVYSNKLHKVLGQQGAEILSRVMGLLLTAIALEFIISGIKTALHIV
jgi:multiple antibiotic resistance protein